MKSISYVYNVFCYCINYFQTQINLNKKCFLSLGICFNIVPSLQNVIQTIKSRSKYCKCKVIAYRTQVLFNFLSSSLNYEKNNQRQQQCLSIGGPVFGRIRPVRRTNEPKVKQTQEIAKEHYGMVLDRVTCNNR